MFRSYLFAFLAVFLVLSLSGCGGPSEKDIRDLVLTAATMRQPEGWEISQFRIFNSYTKALGNETVYFYEMDLSMRRTAGDPHWMCASGKTETDPTRYQIALVKEGREWRYVGDLTGPMDGLTGPRR